MDSRYGKLVAFGARAGRFLMHTLIIAVGLSVPTPFVLPHRSCGIEKFADLSVSHRTWGVLFFLIVAVSFLSLSFFCFEFLHFLPFFFTRFLEQKYFQLSQFFVGAGAAADRSKNPSHDPVFISSSQYQTTRGRIIYDGGFASDCLMIIPLYLEIRRHLSGYDPDARTRMRECAINMVPPSPTKLVFKDQGWSLSQNEHVEMIFLTV